MAAWTKPLVVWGARRFASSSERAGARCCHPLSRSCSSVRARFSERFGPALATAEVPLSADPERFRAAERDSSGGASALPMERKRVPPSASIRVRGFGCVVSAAMDPLSFDGRVAVVTGAGGGLGRSHALELARRGAHVVVNDLGGAVDGTGGSASAAELVVAEIRAAGGEAVANADSVATPAGGAAIVQCALDTFGGVDIVVNNAGILRDAAFKNVEPELLDPVIDVHLKGAFNVLRPAWPRLREQNYGRIVNTTSGSGMFGNFGQSNRSEERV